MTRRFLFVATLATMSIAPARSIAAQSAILTGTVVRDSAGNTIAEAEVTMPALNRTTRTNYRGEFRLAGVLLLWRRQR